MFALTLAAGNAITSDSVAVSLDNKPVHAVPLPTPRPTELAMLLPAGDLPLPEVKPVEAQPPLPQPKPAE